MATTFVFSYRVDIAERRRRMRFAQMAPTLNRRLQNQNQDCENRAMYISETLTADLNRTSSPYALRADGADAHVAKK